MNGRISVVFMANIQKHDFMMHQNLKKDVTKKQQKKLGVL